MVRWTTVIAGGDAVRMPAVWRFAADLRDRLAGPGGDPLVLLVAERVVLAWLFAAWADGEYLARAGSRPPKEERIHLARVEMAQRSLLTACRTLAKVKRGKLADVLNVVSVQVPAGPNGHGPRAVETVPGSDHPQGAGR
jgi:hypothetical protein